MRRIAWMLAASALGCGAETITLPTPPMAAETAQLVATYEMPTATLNLGNIDQVRSDAQSRIDASQLDWFPGLVSDALSRLKTRLDEAGLPDDPAATPNSSRPQLTAVATIHRICAGWDNPAGGPNETDNGSVEVTAIADTGRINPEVWGISTACHARFPPADSASALAVVNSAVVNATIDGTLIIYLLGPLPRTGAEAQFLVSFTGSIGVGGQVVTTSFDFQIVNRAFKVRVPVGSGDAIVTVGSTLGIAGANASFSCDLTTLSCQSS